MFRTKRAAVVKPVAGDLEGWTLEIGRELLGAARAGGAGAMSRKFWSDKLIGWALKDEAFKVQLFRFIDVFPVLKTPGDVHEHLAEYLSQPGVTLPAGMGLGLKAGGIFKGALASTIGSQVEGMAGNFIAGEDVRAALPGLAERWKRGIAFSVDLLGEACVSQVEAGVYRGRYLELMRELAEAAAGWPENLQLERDHIGVVPRVNVSVKISAMDGHVGPRDFAGSLDRLVGSMGPILKLAGEKDIFINFDMENFALKDLTIALFKRCVEEFEFPAGLALQAYLKSAEADARGLVEWAKAKKKVVTVRLIKGAYWDFETIHAEMMGWECPVWGHKVETDACFERVTDYLVREMPRGVGEFGVKLALGTHNVRSVAHAMAAAEKAGLPRGTIEFQTLRGMAEEMKGAIAERGWRMREYVPVGEMIPGMAYLVRRLLENTSNEGWLRAGQAEAVSDEELLASPHEAAGRLAEAATLESPPADGHGLAPAYAEVAEGRAFRNEPLRDFSSASVRESFRKAVESAKVPGVKNDSTVEQAKAAVGEALAGFAKWRELSQVERSGILVKAAAGLRERRDELAGVIVKESSKTWEEADGDVCEAIDFCEYYAREAMGLFLPRRLGRFVGELNEEFFEPRGVAAVISPWNFPLSICTGMTVAGLVTGNAVVMKPAEQTPGIAGLLCEVLWRAGVPKEVLRFVPGVGETVGAALVRDSRVAIVAFTGSKAVGLDIVRAAAETGSEQTFVKRVVCEMGGKNAMIVDGSADLDEAVLAVRQSAFGYSGQKCSAGSRCIVVDSVHDVFVSRLVEATRALVVGDPVLAGTDVGPVIDEEAAGKIWRYVEIGLAEAELAYPDKTQNTKHETRNAWGRRLIPPHIFVGVRAGDAIAREEIFGPVLAVLRAKDFAEALEMANGSAYKLTGGIFSRTPSHLAEARRRFRVGNLYINRGITGALVGRQPFGGFELSGVGAKAGGSHYLLQFVDPRIVTENTMRRGFAPGEG